jgi:hypothetical protein
VRAAEDPLGGLRRDPRGLGERGQHASGTKVTVRLSATKDHHPGVEMFRPMAVKVTDRLRVESRHGRGTRVITALPMYPVAW